MDITIRPALEKDYPGIIQMIRDFAAFEKLPEKMTNSVERMAAEKEFFNCFVATNGDQIVGYVTYFFCYYTWSGKSLYMDDLYIRDSFRGQGIGTKLLRTVIDFAEKEKCHQLRWQVSSWNEPAIAFYKSMGAVINSVEQNCDLKLNNS